MHSRRIGLVVLLTVVLMTLTAGLILAHGIPLWDPDGVALCIAAGAQYQQDIVSYNNNGAVVAWTDTRDLSTTGMDIYTQYVQSDGYRPWATQGVSVCTHTSDQYTPVVCEVRHSGEMYLIYAWVDERYDTTLGKEIYAQRINSDGSYDSHWVKDGYPACGPSGDGGDQIEPEIVPDNTGGAIVVWEDWQVTNDVNLFAQRMASTGALQWYPLAGITVCNHLDDQKNHAVISDGAGGAIIVWEDHRSGAITPDIYAQRLNSAGTRVWTPNGVPICDASGAQRAPQIVGDGDEGAIVVWQDGRGAANDIYAQRVDKNGNVQWTLDGKVVCDAAGEQQNPRMIAMGDEYVIAWRDFRGGTLEGDVYAQRIDQAGERKWTPANGVDICTAAGAQAWPTLAIDDVATGAVIISWQDSRSANYDIYAQRVESNGTIDWPANGVPICTFDSTQQDPLATADAHGGVIIVWQDNRNHRGYEIYDLYAQRIRDFDHQVFLPLVNKQYPQ